jgi:hypothetical protein
LKQHCEEHKEELKKILTNGKLVSGFAFAQITKKYLEGIDMSSVARAEMNEYIRLKDSVYDSSRHLYKTYLTPTKSGRDFMERRNKLGKKRKLELDEIVLNNTPKTNVKAVKEMLEKK